MGLTRFDTINARLVGCHRALIDTALTPQRRVEILNLIDDLLDERNQLRPPMPLASNMTKACIHCYTQRPIHYVPSEIAGRPDVQYVDCPTCDRRKCQCGVFVADVRARKCPAGHWLDR